MTKPTSGGGGGGGGGWVAHRHNLLIERRGHIDPLQQQPRHQRCDNAAQRAESGARKQAVGRAHLARGPEPVGVAPRGGEPSALLGQDALKEQLAVCEVALVARRLQRVATQAGVSASGGIHQGLAWHQVASPAVGNSLHVMYMNACSPALQSREGDIAPQPGR